MGKLTSGVTSRTVLGAYAAWMALLVIVYYAVPQARALAAALIDLSSVAAIVVGVARYDPASKAPWLLIAAANLTGAIGELSAEIQQTLSHVPLPFPSFADAAYLAQFPLYVAGLALFIRSRFAQRDRRGTLDVLILIAGLGLLLGLYYLVPNATNARFSWAGRFVSVAYPIGDLLILMALARLLVPGAGRRVSSALLTAGLVAGIAANAAYDLMENAGNRHGGALLTLGLLACYIAWGAAVLHPSMAELTEPAGPRAGDSAAGSVVMLMVASLLPPIVLFVHAYQKRDAVDGTIAVACGVLYLLMLSRLWDVASSHRRSLLRERTLRMAGAALASARSVEDVGTVLREAASALVPDVPVGWTAILTVRAGDGERLRRVGPGAEKMEGDHGDPVRLWQEMIGGRRPKYATLEEMNRAREEEEDIWRPAHGGPALVGPVEGALLIPLTLKDRLIGDPFMGLLVVFGARRTLLGLSATLEILGSQAALAVERVTLTQEVARQRGEALFRTLIQDASDVILIIGDDRKIRYATPSAADMFGEVSVEGAALTELVASTTRDDIDRVLSLMLSLRGGASPGYLLRVDRLDGRPAMMEIRWSDLRADPTVNGLVLTLRDVTEQHQLEEELKYQAFHDALTGLPNRTLFAREAGEALATARAAGRTAGVLFVDLDDFKVVNDTLGHGVGDELLMAVAARLESSVRASDVAARLGGDEFALLIDDAEDAQAVEAFAERIVIAFNEPFTLSDAKVVTTATIGVATSQDSTDVDEVLRHADLALYAAKSAGKRRWRRYAPVLSAGMIKRRETQAALDDAVKTSAFILAYQPIVTLTSGEIVGFEALLRWPHPRWGMLLPGQFIELAEETGHIVPLGAWVLRKALADMAGWRSRLPPPQLASAPGGPAWPADAGGAAQDSGPHVSVNVSARQFHDPGFVEGVREVMRSSGLPPSALLLELTESVLLGGDERIRAELAELKKIGVRLAIDDFGTGYSSLGYLLELPIDVLKIDKTFVTGIASSWRRYALVEGIVRLARTLEVEVIAEGIETETERELLAGMGCQFGQGYLLSVPVDANAAESLLRLGHGLVPELPLQRRVPPARTYLTDL
jgi:diguanylate cyclase (GGDEF)-like protein/PAS domain S-box-containing protein